VTQPDVDTQINRMQITQILIILFNIISQLTTKPATCQLKFKKRKQKTKQNLTTKSLKHITLAAGH